MNLNKKTYMKKNMLKKLQSLTAIFVLNTASVGVVQASIGHEAETTQSRVLIDERRKVSNNDRSEDDILRSLYLEGSQEYIAKQLNQSSLFLPDDAQLTLALIEESYQDGVDSLLDQYEEALKLATLSFNADLADDAKNRAEVGIFELKRIRQAKTNLVNQKHSLL